MFITASFTVAHIWKQPKHLLKEQINCGILHSIKKWTTNIHKEQQTSDKNLNRLDLNSIKILLANTISKTRQAQKNGISYLNYE